MMIENSIVATADCTAQAHFIILVRAAAYRAIHRIETYDVRHQTTGNVMIVALLKA